ncbi:methyl-accepting chemotaxis protein [Ramlibacter sp. MMS24-I3-19]|uniref:methyl-accepting chemotaxis protein n=1 Tax=Ramlibacter sp. MMS24-I3-19 TaxID=3416606 RepID=UPI003D03806F
MRDLRISTRLSLAFGLMALLIVLLGTVTLFKVSSIEQRFDEVMRDRYPKIARLVGVKDDVNFIARSMRNVLLSDDPSVVRQEKKAVLETRARIVATLKELDPQLRAPKARAALEGVLSTRERFVESQDRLFAIVAAGQDTEARSFLFAQTRPAQQEYMAKLDALITIQREQMDESARAAASSVGDLRAMVWVVGAAALLAAALLAWAIVRSITQPLRKAVAVSRAVANGDLSVSIEAEGRNETAQLLSALREMQTGLAKVVTAVRQNADSVATASGQISQGNNDLSSRTEEQASALQQTAASMKQLAETVQQNAANAQQGNELAMTASGVAARGGEVVGKVVETMKGINDSSRKIADIISVIDGIAFQTNILALNAAVEAARAGEQGRGFAVVASEVRSLAQRSADAAKEIKGLITASVERVEQGSALVNQAGTTMDEVVQSIRRVTDLMGEISAASREQSQGVAQIGDAVNQMDQATQQNAALVEESAAAADSLKTQAQQLVGAVSVFRTSRAEASNSPLPQPVAAARIVRPVSRAKALTHTAVPSARTGTDDDWQSF